MLTSRAFGFLLQLRKAWNQSRKEYTTLQKKLKDMEANLESLKAEAETSDEVPTIDTTDMENDIREAEEAVEDIKKREVALQDEIEALHPGIDETKSQLDEVSLCASVS